MNAIEREQGASGTRRVVYYNYPTSGVGAALSRLGEIADNHGDQGGRTRYASYGYLGAGTMVDANYPAVTGIPALTYGARVNSYSGLDRFGRVVDQKWQNQSGTPTVNDRFKYAYDPPSPRLRWAGRASNRLSREVSPDGGNPDANDNYYTYDPASPERLRGAGSLDRLTQSNRGELGDWGVYPGAPGARPTGA